MIIAPKNNKGGVGKTTMALNIAASLSIMGYRVGIVDADTQSHISYSLDKAPTPALYTLMLDKHAVMKDHIDFIPSDMYSPADNPAKGALFLLSGSPETFNIASQIDQNDTFAFVRLMDKWRAEYQLDFIIVDTSPTIQNLDGLVNLAVDGYIYITQPEKLSLQGTRQAIGTLQAYIDNRWEFMQRHTTVLGILPNLVRPRTDAHQIGLDALRKEYPGYVWDHVTMRIVWAEASLMGSTIFNHAPTSPAAKEAWNITRQLLKAAQAWQQQINATN